MLHAKSSTEQDLLKQVQTPLDRAAMTYLSRKLGPGFTMRDVLSEMDRQPDDPELLLHARQYAASEMINPLTSEDARTLVFHWDGLSRVEQSEAVARLLDLL